MPVDPIGEGRDTPPRLGMSGISVTIPDGWEVRIRRSAEASADERRFPVLHASTEPLPNDRADYGGGVVEHLRSEDVFVALLEFGDEAVGSKLYPPVEQIPRVTGASFHPFQLQRRIVGQGGSQTFFTYRERAFCLYVVVGSFARRVSLAARANDLISKLEIETGT